MRPRQLSLPLIVSLLFILIGCATETPAPDAAIRSSIAPTGILRVGVYSGSPMSLVRDSKTGAQRGLVYDLGKALAERLGVPFQLVEYRTLADVHAALKASQIDLAGNVITPARAGEVDFSFTVIEIELGYLVAAGSRLVSASDVQRQGAKVGVVQGSTSQTTLPRLLPNAVIVPVATLRAGAEMLAKGDIDAFATNKAILFEMSDGLSGSRVLNDRWGAEQWATAIPKGREAGLSYLNQFLAQAKASGLVKAALQNSGLRGANIVQP